MAGFLSSALAALLGNQQQPQPTFQAALGLPNQPSQQTLQLPQAYQPGGMAGIPTAQQEALQPSNLTGDLIRRIYGPNFERTYGQHYGKMLTDIAASGIPLMMTAAGLSRAPEGGVGALEETGGAIEGLLGGRGAAPTVAETAGGPTQPLANWQRPSRTYGLGKYPWASQPNYRAPATKSFEPIYTTQTFGHYPEPYTPFRFSAQSELKQQALEDPLTQTPTGELQMPKGQTGPLRGLAQQPERYHGTPMDIVQVTHPSVSSDWEGNLYGAGLYTTNDFTTAEGYAGQYGEKGQIYRTHEIQPVKFFDIDKQRFPDHVWESLGNPRMAEFFGAGGRRTELEEPIPLKDQHIESQFAWLKRNGKLKDVVEMLKKEGYGGFKHTGGARSGNIAHEVKIYWDPERQVAMRRSPFHFGAEAAEEPTVNYPGYFPPKD